MASGTTANEAAVTQ